MPTGRFLPLQTANPSATPVFSTGRGQGTVVDERLLHLVEVDIPLVTLAEENMVVGARAGGTGGELREGDSMRSGGRVHRVGCRVEGRRRVLLTMSARERVQTLASWRRARQGALTASRRRAPLDSDVAGKLQQVPCAARRTARSSPRGSTRANFNFRLHIYHSAE